MGVKPIRKVIYFPLSPNMVLGVHVFLCHLEHMQKSYFCTIPFLGGGEIHAWTHALGDIIITYDWLIQLY